MNSSPFFIAEFANAELLLKYGARNVNVNMHYELTFCHNWISFNCMTVRPYVSDCVTL